MQPNAFYDSTAPYPRDLIGYGPTPPHAQWPNGARIAVGVPTCAGTTRGVVASAGAA